MTPGAKPPTVVRLDDLNADERRLVLALLAAGKADAPGAGQEDDRERRIAAGARALAERERQASSGGVNA